MTHSPYEDVARLLKHAHTLERSGRKGDAEITYSAASEIARMRSGLHWQPIETVPRDRTPVLLWLPIQHLGSHMAVGYFGEKGKSSIVGGIFSFDLESQPTHWMNLPPPPSS